MARKKEVRRRHSKLPKLEVVAMMLEGKDDEEIAKKYNTTASVVSKVIHRHIKEVTNVRETQVLIKTQKGTIKKNVRVLKTMASTRTINKKFMDLLSEPDADELSESETMFALTYILTGEAKFALEEAGLDAGLQAPNSKDRNNMGYCKRLRCQYLLNKLNVAQAIKAYRDEKFKKQLDGIDKRYTQKELLMQLDEMKHAPGTQRKDILSCLRMIGETEGAFTQNINVGKIDPGEALDELIEMVSGGSEGEDEFFEMEED